MKTDKPKKCKSECMPTSSMMQGKRLMISQQDGKFPAGQQHSQCDECLEAFLNNPELKKAEQDSRKDTYIDLKYWLIKERQKKVKDVK